MIPVIPEDLDVILNRGGLPGPERDCTCSSGQLSHFPHGTTVLVITIKCGLVLLHAGETQHKHRI